MSFNKESNGFIVTFLVIMVVIVALVLSLVTSALGPMIRKNQVVDKKTKILKSVLDFTKEESKTLFTADFVLAEYNSKITEVVVDYKGESKTESNAFDLDFKKETRKPVEERSYPIFVYNSGSKKFYIIPVIGLGLWDEISGYVAVEDDFITLKGAAFDHKGETPGLGAKIAEYWYGKQFEGKKLFDENGEYVLTFLKGEGNELVESSPIHVDGMSGATITANGADAMLRVCVEYYRPYFKNTNS